MLFSTSFAVSEGNRGHFLRPRRKTHSIGDAIPLFLFYESWCPMKLVNIGFGNMVNADRIVAMIAPDSAPVKRVIQDAREKGMLVDASYGRKTQAVVIMDSGHVVLSGIPLDTVTGRIAEEPDE